MTNNLAGLPSPCVGEVYVSFRTWASLSRWHPERPYAHSNVDCCEEGAHERIISHIFSGQSFPQENCWVSARFHSWGGCLNLAGQLRYREEGVLPTRRRRKCLQLAWIAWKKSLLVEMRSTHLRRDKDPSLSLAMVVAVRAPCAAHNVESVKCT